jgi:putative flippase GtrA
MPRELRQFIRFCISGGTAFAVDTLTLELVIHYASLEPAIARTFSVALGMQVGYLMHAHFTFRREIESHKSTWLRFIASNITGATINYTVFVSLLYGVLEDESRKSRLIAIVAGTAVGLCFNYWANKRFVFNGAPRP